MASTASGIEYPTAGDPIAPLNGHLQVLAETVQEALDARTPAVNTSYTPTFTGLTLGNGTVSAKYCKVGGVIVDEIVITFGSTTAITGEVKIAGMQAASSSAQFLSSTVALIDVTGGYSVGAARQYSATNIEIHAQTSSGAYVALASLSSTVPHTWATGDQIIVKTVRLAA